MSARWIRRLLGLAPRAFRDRYADEMLATYAERERLAAAEGRLFSFRTRELVGVAWLVVRLRLGLESSAAGREHGREEASTLSATWQDARYALRTLRRSPSFSLTAIVVLALGIGATSAIVSAVDTYFFRPLPFADPDRLVTVYETNPEYGWVDATAAPANLLDWRERVTAFEDVSGYLDFTDQIAAFPEGDPVVLVGRGVLGNFFSTLGAAPALGRVFRYEESWRAEDRVVVISHDLWVNLFGSDPNIIGRSLEFGSGPREIVGVMPEGFHFPNDGIQMWYPVGWDLEDRDIASFRRAHYVRAFARLAPGVTHEEADADLQRVVGALQVEYPGTNRVMGAGIVSMRDFLTRDVRTSMGVLLGAVTFLLLLACANVANLQLVRVSERDREISLRRALGAGKVRLVRQMLIESLLLAGAGGAAGLGLGWLILRLFDGLTRVGIEGATSLTLDYRVVLYTFGAAALSAVIFGVTPALRAVSGSADDSMPERARGSTAAREHLRLAGVFVSVQVALALMLAVGAGLMVRSYWLLGRVDPGFRADGVLAVQFSIPAARYGERDDVLAFYDRFAAALEARPGVERVGYVARLPLDGPSWSSQFKAEGWPVDRVGVEILHRRADRGYFEALEIPLVRGRFIDATDRADQPFSVVINETFASEHFPGEDPIGQRIAFTREPTPETTWHEIVGIVRDQRQERMASPARAEVFESRYQDWGRSDWVVIRTSGDPSDLVPVVREVLRETDALIPLANIRPLADVREASVAREQLILRLLGAFGATALLLATVGVYAVTSRAARRRTQEIGIRMALGAGSSDVLGLMLKQGLGVVGVGLAIGIAATLLTTRVLTSLLYGVEPTDPVTLVSVVALLGGVALAACYLPARRATAVDPLTSLKTE